MRAAVPRCASSFHRRNEPVPGALEAAQTGNPAYFENLAWDPLEDDGLLALILSDFAEGYNLARLILLRRIEHTTDPEGIAAISRGLRESNDRYPRETNKNPPTPEGSQNHVAATGFPSSSRLIFAPFGFSLRC